MYHALQVNLSEDRVQEPTSKLLYYENRPMGYA